MQASEELFVTLPTRVRLCYQTFGDPCHPAVIFVPGHSGSMLSWPEDMLRQFSTDENPRFIIRYDPRDTGLSTEFPVPANYSLTDMANDVEGLVDHLGLSAKGFHIIGASMGGPVAYIVTLRRPSQVRSLTLAFASPGATKDLPLKGGIDVAPPFPMGIGNQRRVYIDFNMDVYDALTTQPDAEERKEFLDQVTATVDREMKSGTLYSKGANHGTAAFGDRPGLESLKDIKCPTTIIQSNQDPYFGEAHGEAFASVIEDSEYVLWNDVGHELPRRIWGRFAEVLLRTWKKGDEKYTS
ncbi:hypothetical protein N3K66_001628 [Trichothecium roseum]|uniref:Uncharacterized protein n=1 Tax=Trichothecium roseum TaxID=47278 RepID=A0ACC0V714_9HYPO|nr:hypothetical protein N3K66_001628 [Trichothecium roseum]